MSIVAGSIATRTERDRTPSPRLIAIKAVHSAAFLAILSAILWLVATGLVGRRDRSVAVAAALVAGEAAVFLANDGVCPLTPLAERHGANRGGVSDIFLPDRLARTIPIWSTALVALAAALHARHAIRSVGAVSGCSTARGPGQPAEKRSSLQGSASLW